MTQKTRIKNQISKVLHNFEVKNLDSLRTYMATIQSLLFVIDEKDFDPYKTDFYHLLTELEELYATILDANEKLETVDLEFIKDINLKLKLEIDEL